MKQMLNLCYMPGPLLSVKDSTINRNDKSTYPGGREAGSISEAESTREDGRCYGEIKQRTQSGHAAGPYLIGWSE